MFLPGTSKPPPGWYKLRVTGAIVAVVILQVVGSAQPVMSSTQRSSSVAVEQDPLVRIGAVDGPDEYMFEFVVDAAVLPNGALLAADRGTGELRIYDRDGGFLRAFGGEGEGPREFRFIHRVLVRADTIIITDPMLGKEAHFSVHGEFIRTRPFAQPGASLIGIADGGRRWWSWMRGTTSGPAPRVTADTLVVGHSMASQAEVAWVSGTSGTWRYQGRPYPFAPVTEPVPLREFLLVADPVRGEIAVVDPAGTRARRITVPLPEPDPAAAWRILEREMERRDDLQQFRNVEIPRVDRLPRMGAMLVDSADRIWIKEYDPAEDASWLGGWAGGEGGQWVVLDAEGKMLGRVIMPPRLVPLYIGDGLLLGRYRGEFDVQYLSVHRVGSGQ